jgi:O-succinylbenzoic acid--CoA ligase
VSSLRPVRGTAAQILGLLREWDAAADPDPLIVETSGSTGAPKRVVLSRAAMRASAAATLARLGGPGQWLLNLPPTYVAGLQVLFRSVRAGTEPVVHDGGFADDAAGLTGERRYVSLVPTQLTRMLRSERDRAALRGFDTVLVGGARVDPALRQAAAEAGVTVVATYGASETCGGCVYDGVALDGVAVVVGADRRIRIGGPVVFDGYDGQPELTAEVRQDGWYRTQDVGRFDEDGRLEVLGRLDDVLISGGVNVPAGAVAARLRAHPGVSAAEVVGVPDAEWGQRVVAVLIGEIGLQEARDWVAAELPRTWAPRQLVPVTEIPLLGNGKVDRVRLLELAGRSGWWPQ